MPPDVPDARPDRDDDALRAFLDASAAQRLREQLADRRGEPPPLLDGAFAALAEAHRREATELAWVVDAAGFEQDELDDADTETLLELVASTIVPTFETSPQAEATLALDHIRWFSLLVRLTMLGQDAVVDPEELQELVEEVVPDPSTVDEQTALGDALAVVLPAWRAIGVLDEEWRLTAAGLWLLPRGACYAWDTDFDDPEAVDGPGSWEVPFADEPIELAPDEQRLADAAVAQLAAARALSPRDLVRGVSAAVGEEVAPDALEDVLRLLSGVMPLRDGRIAHLPSMLDGVVLTHRFSAVERELGALVVHPDLAALVWVSGDRPVAGGGTAGVRYRRGHPLDVHEGLVGPDGWLADFETGDLLAVVVTDGTLGVTRLEEHELDEGAAARTVERLAETHERLGGANPAGGPIDGPELLLETLGRAPKTLSTPQPPLGELLARAGLDLDAWTPDEEEDWDDEAGSDLVAPDEHDELLAEVYGLDEGGIAAHHLLAVLVEQVAEGRAEASAGMDLGDLAALVADVAVVESVVDQAAHRDSRWLGALREVAVALHDRSRGRARAATAYLRFRTAEHLGATEEGEALLGEALDADPGCRPALLDAAWYAEDRGEAVRALSLVRRARVGAEDQQLRRLEAWAAPTTGPKVGRNDPCPCGSGRKYKVCCHSRGGRPLAERAGWLLDKAGTYAHRAAHRPLLLPIVEARAGDPRDPHRLSAAIRDPLVQDLGLFEEGLLELFLDDRGVLLPADELELGRSWLDTRRGLFEVVDVRPGEGMTLLDLSDGERLRVVERAGSQTLRPGEAVYARPLPVPGHHVLAAGTLRIPVQHRESLLAFLDTDPGGPAQAAWVAALEAPPALVTMEGEDTVFCEATYAVSDPDETRRALSSAYEEVGDDEWIERVDSASGRWTRGTLTLTGDRLVVRTNAVPRLQRFQQTLADLLPGASLIDEERRPMADLAPDPDGAPPPDVEPSAEQLAVIEGMLRDYEDRWIDEPVPLLGGLTPRQAAEDPTRRGQLRALLDEIEAQPPSGPLRGMDAPRLRQRLGL